MRVREIKSKYDKRIMSLLESFGQALREDGYAVDGPEDVSGDDYRWSLWAKKGKASVDVTFTICESEHFDGEKGGVNFEVMIVETGGRILGQIAPSNYAPDCWVPRRDKIAVEDRFRLVENVPALEIVLAVRRAA